MGAKFEVDLASLPSSKREAISSGSKFFFTGRPCRNGHLSARKAFPNRSKCVECMRVGAKRATAAYVLRNREKTLDSARKYQALLRSSGLDWGAKNPEKYASMKAKWKSENLDKGRATAMKRKAVQLNAMPSWLSAEDQLEMDLIYKMAAEISRYTGIQREVDHIVPLQGRTVCGLHVPWNLRVIPATVNNRRPRIWDHQQETPNGFFNKLS